MNRILVIRGGAIGDFILTLPALKALRDARPRARIEILGYKHIAVLAENRFYAQAVHSIEYGLLARFFARNSELPAELADYFASFDLVISYLYDPDEIFESNLRRCGVENLLCGPAKIADSRSDGLPTVIGHPTAGKPSFLGSHAARQLARPIEELGIDVVNFSFNRRSGICPRISRVGAATDYRHTPGKRQPRQELASGKVDRLVFAGQSFR
jgi:hypothetical protein